ncbi:MAG: hypothetical protein HY595_00435, partial [Candidatus Omnitrophica bacterium]|nr:hypothetical protein [Candidatus Omnitrophota bacterium]
MLLWGGSASAAQWKCQLEATTAATRCEEQATCTSNQQGGCYTSHAACEEHCLYVETILPEPDGVFQKLTVKDGLKDTDELMEAPQSGDLTKPITFLVDPLNPANKPSRLKTLRTKGTLSLEPSTGTMEGQNVVGGTPTRSGGCGEASACGDGCCGDDETACNCPGDCCPPGGCTDRPCDINREVVQPTAYRYQHPDGTVRADGCLEGFGIQGINNLGVCLCASAVCEVECTEDAQCDDGDACTNDACAAGVCTNP